MKNNIGIVGNGFVGGAVANGIKPFADIRIYDALKERSTHHYNDVIFSDFIFVCLPTPMVDVEGGKCNLSIVEKFFEELPSVCDGIFIIKSTVPIGTTKKLCEKYPHLKIIHNPEFLTAANANDDFINADRTVLGGEKEWVKPVKKMYKKIFPNIPIYTMKSTESECVKYFANCFLASKLMFFNEMKVFTESIKNVNYDTIIEGVISDNRIGNSHYDVPGPDGEYGFGGTCFPKDINSLIHTMEEHEVDPMILRSVWKQNKNYRLNWDWADFSSAVLKEKEEV
jgi:UDPglucose 6-dehydrogenase|tara:strand:- start:803 stop:1651 length:849 start_codon:yes stop_codon:yes gene_type:complete